MKRLYSTILTVVLAYSGFAQTSVSFYHLGPVTYQHSAFNPSWIPDGGWFLGLPVLSGVHIHGNNKLSYNELFTKEANQVTVDIDKALTNLQSQNMTSVHTNVSLLHLGFTLGNGALLSVFANERVESDALYPKKAVEFVWNGNSTLLNEQVKLGQIGLRGTYFREIGLGYAKPVNEYLSVGARLKYLVGFLDVSTPGNMVANLTTDGEFFQLDGELKNAQLRTSGLDIFDGSQGDLGSHLLFNSNTGVSLDIGATYRLSPYYTITGSILDIGFIGWKENIVNETLSDTTFRYDGVNLDGIGDIRQTLEDSLFSKFETRETNDAYRSFLPLKAYGSWIYHYNDKTDLYATIGARMIHGQLKMLYGGGLTHEFGKVMTASVSATKLPQQFFNLGAAIALQGGPIQYYMAADQIINFSAPDFKSFDFRFGINFKFPKVRIPQGNRVSTPKVGGAKGYDTNVFLGKQVKTKRREGIYSVIKKQNKREVNTDQSKNQKKKVKKRSLTGMSATKGSKEKKRVQKRSLTGQKGKTTGKSTRKKVQKKSLNGRGASKGKNQKKKKVQKKSLTGRKFN